LFLVNVGLILAVSWLLRRDQRAKERAMENAAYGEVNPLRRI